MGAGHPLSASSTPLPSGQGFAPLLVGRKWTQHLSHPPCNPMLRWIYTKGDKMNRRTGWISSFSRKISIVNVLDIATYLCFFCQVRVFSLYNYGKPCINFKCGIKLINLTWILTWTRYWIDESAS